MILLSEKKAQQKLGLFLLNGKVLLYSFRPKSQYVKHLTEQQRYQIASLHEQDLSSRQIASRLDVHHSTICREIKRNGKMGHYCARTAHQKCVSRHRAKNKHIRFTSKVQQQVDSMLQLDYSPDQINGYCRSQQITMDSNERIYQYIWEDKHGGGKLYMHLRNKGRKRHKRGRQKRSRSLIKNRIDIDQRPAIVNQRTRFGDLEIDTIIGEHHKGAIVTINDRKTGYLWAQKIPVRSAGWTAEVAINQLDNLKDVLHTITSDNGLEFAQHELISNSLDIDFYFAHRYKSYQRGSNENLNGLLRQYIPKKTDLTKVSKEDLENYCKKINDRPRKRYGYRSPTFIMKQELKLLGVAFIT